MRIVITECDHDSFAPERDLTDPVGADLVLTQSRTAAELSRSIAPFAPFFAFQVKQLETREEPASRRARAGVLSIA